MKKLIVLLLKLPQDSLVHYQLCPLEELLHLQLLLQFVLALLVVAAQAQDVCNICQTLVAGTELLIAQDPNLSAQEVETFLNRACNISFLKPYYVQCELVIQGYADKIVSELFAGTSGLQVCENLDLCHAAKGKLKNKNARMGKHHAQKGKHHEVKNKQKGKHEQKHEKETTHREAAHEAALRVANQMLNRFANPNHAPVRHQEAPAAVHARNNAPHPTPRRH